MGCASSSPMIAGNGGIVDAAKNAANDVVHAGEEVLHDVGEGINDTVSHVKNAVVGAVRDIGQGLEKAVDGDEKEKPSAPEVTPATNNSPKKEGDIEYTYIPLKDPNAPIDGHLEEFKENLLKKAQSFSDDTEKLTDELIKDTDDLLNDTTNAVKSKIETVKENIKDELDYTPTHSIDSLKTSSPDPEIEKILQSDSNKSPPSPEPTLSELKDIIDNTLGNDIDLRNGNETSTNKLEKPTIKTGIIPLNPFDEQPHEIIEQANIVNRQALIDKMPLSKHSSLMNETRKTLKRQTSTVSEFNDFDLDDNGNNETVINDVEPTHWEKLADRLPKLPIMRLDPELIETTLKSSSIENILEHIQVE